MSRLNDLAKVLTGVMQVAGEASAMFIKSVRLRAPFMTGLCDFFGPSKDSSFEFDLEEDLPDEFKYGTTSANGAKSPHEGVRNDTKRHYHTLRDVNEQARFGPGPYTNSSIVRRGVHTSTLALADAVVNGHKPLKTPANRKRVADSKERKVPATRLERIAAFGGVLECVESSIPSNCFLHVFPS